MPRFAMIESLARAAGGQLFEVPCPKTGIAIRGLVWAPPHPEEIRAGVLLLHGLQSNSLWFSETAEHLARNGIVSVAVDRRGSGLSDGHLLSDRSLGQSPIPKIIGVRGHLNRKEEFFYDVEIGYQVLKNRIGTEVPAHLFANCFASRIAVSFHAENRDLFDSLILVAPSTDIRSEANLRIRSQLKILSPFVSKTKSLPSPLQDEWLVPQGEKLAWIRDDAQSLSLRSFSKGFATATLGLNRLAKRAITSSQSALFLAVADHDQIVDSDKAKRRFAKQWQDSLECKSYPCEHFIEFSEAAGSDFRADLTSWILSNSLRTMS